MEASVGAFLFSKIFVHDFFLLPLYSGSEVREGSGINTHLIVFEFMSQEITPRSSTVWAEETGITAQNAATILKLLVPNPHSIHFIHGATCC